MTLPSTASSVAPSEPPDASSALQNGLEMSPTAAQTLAQTRLQNADTSATVVVNSPDGDREADSIANVDEEHAASGPLLKLAIALLAVSFAPIFIRFSETELSADATVFNRLLVFLLVFGLGRSIVQRLRPTEPETADAEPQSAVFPSDRKQWVLLISVGVVAITSLVLWAMSLEYTTVAKSMLLNNLTPLFTSLGAWLFLGQRFERRFLLGMVLALGGAFYLGFGDLVDTTAGAEAAQHGGQLLGDIYAILSAVFLGAYFLLVERLRQWFSATTILLWRCAVGGVLLLPLVLVQGDQIFPQTTAAVLAVVGLGIVGEGMGQRLIADCMAQLSSSFVSLCLLLEPVLSGLLAWAIFGEAIGQTTWIGFAIVLAGIYLAQSSAPQSDHA